MGDASNYRITRVVLQRGLGLAYLLAFVCALNQFRPLLGEHGLLPVSDFVRQAPFRESPSLFYLAPKDWAFAAAAWAGIVFSCALIAGAADRFGSWIGAALWIAVWILDLSFVNVGQVFYGFGWESLLLEAGFLAIFLGARDATPQFLTILLYRWLLFRLMFGAGLIKLRGDSCWRDLTCLDYHYETQPMPNPLSWYWHWGPAWMHRGGVLFNHFAELAVPFAYFLPQPLSSIAGLIAILFQLLIMAGGNLSWLNFLTIVIAIPTLDDRFFRKLRFAAPELKPTSIGFRALTIALTMLVAILSVNPVRNMLSPGQIMNADFDPLHLVGTYGAFGSITRERYEIVVEGTADAAITSGTQWREYEFKGKPGSLSRIPAQIAPYHLRLDWLMWFAAMGDYTEQSWFVPFLSKLLEGDAGVLSLLAANPFPNQPPHYVQAEIYKYEFTTPEERRKTGNWWKRQLAGRYFPVSSIRKHP